MTKQIITIEGMTCGGCANTVEKKLNSVEEINRAAVDLETNTATIEANTLFDANQLNDVLDVTPYTVVDVKEG